MDLLYVWPTGGFALRRADGSLTQGQLRELRSGCDSGRCGMVGAQYVVPGACSIMRWLMTEPPSVREYCSNIHTLLLLCMC